MRINLGFATVCMVNFTALEEQPTKVEHETNPALFADASGCKSDVVLWSEKSGYNGSIVWTRAQQSLVMSAGFYGGLVTIWFSGYLADRLGPKLIIIGAFMDYVAMSLASPYLASSMPYPVFFAARVVMGLGEGFFLPCLSALTSKWFSANEKASSAAIFTSGNAIGAALTPPISAFLCSSPLGWPAVFYVPAGIGATAMLLWTFFVTNTPSENRYVRGAEKKFLEENLALPAKLPPGVSMPWRKLLWSTASMAVYLCTAVDMACVIITQAFLPQYMKEVLKLPIRENGLYTMVPFVCQIVTKNLAAPFGDHLKRRGILSHTTAVRTFQSISAFGAATCLYLMAIIPDCNSPSLALPLLALYGTFYSTCTMGYFTSMLSIAPPFAGTVASISRTYGTLGQIFGTSFVGALSFLTPIARWQTIFSTLATLKIAAGLFFLRFGAADVQPWAHLPEPESKRQIE